MDERFYDSLELNKILEMLSKECSNEKTKKMALGIKPCSDLYTVKKETGKTAEALELSVRYGTPNFYNINDVSTYIKRAEAGGVLSLGELIQIRRLLAQTYELHHWYEQCENKDTSLSYLFEMLYPNKYLQQRLETAIIDETKLSDDASAELRSIRQKITRSGLKIRETLDKMIKSSATGTLLSSCRFANRSIVTMRDGRNERPALQTGKELNLLFCKGKPRCKMRASCSMTELLCNRLNALIEKVTYKLSGVVEASLSSINLKTEVCRVMNSLTTSDGTG